MSAPTPQFDPYVSTPLQGDDDYIPGEESRTEQKSSEERPERSYKPPQIPPKLFLTVEEPPPPRFPSLSWLSHALGLDVYSSRSISTSARIEMNCIALMLVTILLFGLASWSLLFYFVAGSGSLELSFGGVLAAPIGILPAIALLIYERGFMVADVKSRGWGRLIGPTIVRLVVISAAAYVTAQPIELLVFSQPIERRMHQEHLREDLVSRYRDLVDRRELRGATGYSADVEKDTLERRGQAEQTQAGLQTDRQRADADVNKLAAEQQSALVAVTGALTARNQANVLLTQSSGRPTESAARIDFEQKDAAYQAARTRLQEKQIALAGARAKLKAIDDRLQIAETDVRQKQDAYERVLRSKSGDTGMEMLRKWARKLRGATPGKDFKDPETGYELPRASYTFLDKLRIINDLYGGRSASWPGASPEVRQQLAQEFGLYDDDPETVQANIANVRRTYWAVFSIALLIPVMSLLLKMIMPAPLALYYSSKAQAGMGHPEAMALEGAYHYMQVDLTSPREGQPRETAQTKSWRTPF